MGSLLLGIRSLHTHLIKRFPLQGRMNSLTLHSQRTVACTTKHDSTYQVHTCIYPSYAVYTVYNGIYLLRYFVFLQFGGILTDSMYSTVQYIRGTP